MKPNIGIATFLRMWFLRNVISRNHIPRNLDVMSNVDSPVSNATLETGSLSVH